LQGFTRFGLYEVFKVTYARLIGEEKAYTYRTLMYLAAAASAELFADIPLSPFESIKVRMQTQNGFTSKLGEGIRTVRANEGIYGFYKSIVPLWGRQVPYTMVKFSCFEKTIELLYKHVIPKPRDQSTKAEQLVVTFSAGYIAGVFCAIVSHPADTLFSKLQIPESTIGSVWKELGFFGVWNGIGPRILMIGALAASQWFIYDGAKVAFNLPRPPPPEMPASLRAKLS
jgi:solute carrier family 25 phosphate transporter 3